MKTLHRWVRNIKWLLNRPPTDFIDAEETFPCSYCGNSGWLRFEGYGGYAFCIPCLKKAMDKALNEKDKTKTNIKETS